MMAAILANLYTLEASGPGRGYVPASTSWNPNWATDYGPLVDQARKADKAEVQEAIEAVKALPPDVPEYFEDAQEVVELLAVTPGVRSLASKLMENDKSLIIVMTAYYAYRKWRKEDDETAILLLM